MRFPSFLLGLFLLPYALSAGEAKIQVQWSFVSSPNPLFPDQPLVSFGSPEPALEALAGACRVVGVLSSAQIEDTLKKAKENSATIVSLDPAVTTLGKPSVTKKMQAISVAARLLGDTKRHPIEKPPEQPEEKREIGYSLKCTPSASASDQQGLDLALEVSLVQLQGYQDYLLTGGVVGALSREATEIASDDFPMMRCPIINQNSVSTTVSVWKEQSVVLQLSDAKKGSYDYLLVTASPTKAETKP